MPPRPDPLLEHRPGIRIPPLLRQHRRQGSRGMAVVLVEVDRRREGVGRAIQERQSVVGHAHVVPGIGVPRPQTEVQAKGFDGELRVGAVAIVCAVEDRARGGGVE